MASPDAVDVLQKPGCLGRSLWWQTYQVTVTLVHISQTATPLEGTTDDWNTKKYAMTSILTCDHTLLSLIYCLCKSPLYFYSQAETAEELA